MFHGLAWSIVSEFWLPSKKNLDLAKKPKVAPFTNMALFEWYDKFKQPSISTASDAIWTSTCCQTMNAH